MLTKIQKRKLEKVAGWQSVEPSIRISEVDGCATITYWNGRAFREIVISVTGKVLSDTRGYL